MKPTPRLTDLYVVGKHFDVEVEDVKIPLWVQKMNPAEHQEAVLAANAKRAVWLSLKKQHELEEKTQEYLAVANEVDEIASVREALIDLLALTQMVSFRIRREAEVAFEEEWAEDNYYNGLVDSWNSELAERYEKNPEDPEAKRVFDEIQRFNVQVESLVEKERMRVVQDLVEKPDHVLYRRAVDTIIDTRADAAWVNEYKFYQLYLSVRDANTKGRYFSSVSEVKSLDPRIVELLNTFLDDLITDSITGKESEEVQDS